MGIQVDLQSLRRSWYLPSGHLQFLVQVEFGAATPELEYLLEVAAGIRHRLAVAGNSNRADAEGWVRTKAGWSGVLIDAYTIDDGLEWFELFTATWGDAFDGKIVGGPRSRPPTLGSGEPELTAFVAYTTCDLTKVPIDQRARSWFVDDRMTRFIAERATTWAYTRGCRQHLMRDDWEWWVEPIGLDHALALSQGISRYSHCRLICSHEQLGANRDVSMLPQGLVALQVMDPTADWRTRLDSVRAALTWTPPQTDVAFVRHDLGNAPLWDSYVLPWPHVKESQLRYSRPLLSSFVPDANGIQLLTDAHLARATDLSDWRISSLPGGRNLVEAKDLEPWYASTKPNPEALARARVDFGEMILTGELIQANSPWGV